MYLKYTPVLRPCNHSFNVIWGLVLYLILMGGCASRFDLQVRQRVLETQAVQQQMALKIVSVEDFAIQTAERLNPEGAVQACVYIEGDGLTWLTPYKVSPDPTPTFPLSITFSPKNSRFHEFYLTRPCQYTMSQNLHCHKWMWTGAVYSTQQRDLLSSVLDLWKAQYQIQQFHLVGYSGGGVLALLLAAHRSDVSKVTTVASNIDVDAWVRTQDLSPLPDSVNPRHQVQKLCGKKYMFIWGSHDRMVPASPHASFVRELSQCAKVHTRVIEGANHDFNWSSVLNFASYFES